MIDEDVQTPPETVAPEAEGAAGFDRAVEERLDTAGHRRVVAWVEEHGDILWRFVVGRVASREIAEDLVQETLLAALKAHASFSGGSSERTWLLGIAAHKIADHFRAIRRRERAHASLAQSAPRADEDGLASRFGDSGLWRRLPGRLALDPSDASQRAELVAALRRCLESLPPLLGEAVWMRDILNISTAQVCKDLGLTPTTLWTRAHRARAALRECVERAIGVPGKDESC